MQVGFAFLFFLLDPVLRYKGHRGAKLSTSLILPRILKSSVVRQVLFILFLSFLKIDYIFLLSWKLIFQLQMASCLNSIDSMVHKIKASKARDVQKMKARIPVFFDICEMATGKLDEMAFN